MWWCRLVMLLGWAGLLGVGPATAVPNIRPDTGWTWGSNIGWVQWAPSIEKAATLTQSVAHGFVFAPNVGWIHLGDGTPRDGVRYGNDGPEDYGININPDGALRGWAYGANIGWVRFADTGDPRIHWETGRVSGFAYGLNVGWIRIGDSDSGPQIDRLVPGKDSDGDGIPDTWERKFTSNLAQLEKGGDHDSDGVADYAEYIADTDPTDPESLLRIREVVPNPNGSGIILKWSAQPARRYLVEARQNLSSESPWQESGLGLLRASDSTLSVELPKETQSRYFRVRALLPEYELSD